MNIGPRPDGTIPDGMQERLLAIGDWLRVNGEAIYGTRPWDVYGEGEGTPAKPAKGNAIAVRPVEIRYTCKGRDLYAISLARPTNPLVLRAVKGQEVDAVTLLGGGPIAWSMTGAGLRLEPPADLPGCHAWVFKITRKEFPAER